MRKVFLTEAQFRAFLRNEYTKALNEAFGMGRLGTKGAVSYDTKLAQVWQENEILKQMGLNLFTPEGEQEFPALIDMCTENPKLVSVIIEDEDDEIYADEEAKAFVLQRVKNIRAMGENKYLNALRGVRKEELVNKEIARNVEKSAGFRAKYKYDAYNYYTNVKGSYPIEGLDLGRSIPSLNSELYPYFEKEPVYETYEKIVELTKKYGWFVFDGAWIYTPLPKDAITKVDGRPTLKYFPKNFREIKNAVHNLGVNVGGNRFSRNDNGKPLLAFRVMLE